MEFLFHLQQVQCCGDWFLYFWCIILLLLRFHEFVEKLGQRSFQIMVFSWSIEGHFLPSNTTHSSRIRYCLIELSFAFRYSPWFLRRLFCFRRDHNLLRSFQSNSYRISTSSNLDPCIRCSFDVLGREHSFLPLWRNNKTNWT